MARRRPKERAPVFGLDRNLLRGVVYAGLFCAALVAGFTGRGNLAAMFGVAGDEAGKEASMIEQLRAIRAAQERDGQLLAAVSMMLYEHDRGIATRLSPVTFGPPAPK